MPAYLLVDVDVHDPERYEEYRAQAPAAIHAYGGRYLARGGAAELLEGDRTPHRVVVLEFPSVERARAFWASPEYGAIVGIRHATATSHAVLVEGLETPL
jgi:uncharacterized protein (DUF1330 family)